MDLNELFGKHWRIHFAHLLQPGKKLLLAASGGLDSTLLAHLLKAHQIPFAIAHMNFQLRQAESTRDENFVRALGKQLAVDVLVKVVDTVAFSEEKKLSVQESARELRYSWFSDLISESVMVADGLSLIATAHHADDSIETLLMHFFRGTGIEGLKGIPEFNKAQQIIRPLLPFTREQLESFAGKNGIDFVTDSSNLKNDYTRNYFRNQLIPQLQEVFPNVKENLIHNIGRLTEAAGLYRQAVDLQLSKLLEHKGNEIHIPVLKWIKSDTLHTITWEMIKPFGFSAAQITEVIKLAQAANGSTVQSASHRIIKNRAWLILVPMATEQVTHILIEGEGNTIFDNGSLEIRSVPAQTEMPATPGTEWLDAGKIRFPLLLRKWKTGDYFYPLGMTKKKKLAKFFIDLKLSKTQKEAVWVLEMDQKIICIPGYRIDNRFKYGAGSEKLLQISYRM